MTPLNPRLISICIAVLLALGATTSPAIAQEDGLSGGQIILVQDQGKGKKKGQKNGTSGLGICGQPGTSPTQEICGDSLDNDCDGLVDESGCVNN